ncbi:MAG TPA: 4Fe-4S dicluster domain-containing protein [Candidatus Thalassarchaeaceae archaeon]|nr:MAG TPA: 4Fe-4S dicluster domain-containing protein [Candidatus Poseidoniales archaeon]HII34170.1 4Fe-4S dicluster domain-containing protein [Candidatus Thalassarchaeaceae archaeon]
MGMMERFGRIADTYISERDKLIEADKERRRTFTGHPFWPTEVLRDTIIFASIVMTIAFYSWLIPPPLHSAADPFAQAGFVFPDWYVLFSYGYLRWGEYLPQFVIPAGPIGEFLGAPVIDWNAAWWGAAITGLPVGILALPPFLPGREKRGVEDPWFATAGAVYLAHVWFISVFSINIFLDLYAKDRSDYCFTGSHSELMCGRQAPWTAEVFNAVPWILTGVFLFAIIYFPTRKFLLNSVGSRVTPQIGRQVAVGSLLAAVLISVVTWPIYENGFWDYGGLGAMDDLEDLDALRSQPSDTLVHVEEGNVWADWEDECIPYEESQSLAAWNGLGEGEDVADWCVIAASHWSKWGIYQPTKFKIIDFNGDNGHSDSAMGRNAAEDRTAFFGMEDGSEVMYSSSFTFEVEDLGVSEVPTDIGCLFRTSVRSAGTHSQSLVLTDSAGSEIWSTDGCISDSIYLDSGQTYTVDFQTTSQGINDTVEVITSFSVISYQPLLLNADGTALVRSESTMDMETLSSMYMENPTFHKNPKSLDAKLIYSLFVPCLGVGALVFMLMRSMARGYEYEMNKCYGCDLCDDACPVRLFNSGDKLNIIYNTWNNEDDGVPLYSCLTCSACTNACPQLVDYDSYVDIRRNMIVGGPPAAEIPHTVLQAVLAAEAEEDADEDFMSIEDYPIDSNIGYYPGCVDYLDQEMIFSHVNQGTMNLGDATTSAFTLFEEMGEDVTYLGRDFLKCCGHDQKWQGMTEVFEKLKSYNQKKLGESGIDTLVTSCAECFRTFAMDYELDEMKVMHTTEFLVENGFDMNLRSEEDVTVTFHDPCRLGRQMNIYDQPRDLISSVDGVDLVEMEHHGEDALCCGVSSMMSCNENSRALRVQRFEEVNATGADIMLTSCPKCVSHFECLKFEGDPKHDFEILDVVSFLARQVEAGRK